MPDDIHEPFAHEPWESEDLTAEARKAFYAATVAKIDAGRRSADDVRRLSLWFGGCCMGFALIMTTAAASVYFKTPVPKQPGFVAVFDSSSGRMGAAIPITDAPKLFSQAQDESDLQAFITRCEGYVPQTWASADFHACMIMSAPDEQKRRGADIGKDGPRYPPKVFPKGWAMPTAFLAFTPYVTGKDNDHHYEVRYERTEVTDGKETRPRYTAQVYFERHPELAMSPQDRRLNTDGFIATSFSTTKD
jgi:type IV secretory pathway component VirB8